MLEGLPAEQRPIAQQLLRGGIPAVRTALHFEREKAREEGRPEPSTEGVLALAESLVSKVKAAEWRDRAEAAVKAGDDLVMRDLRSLVNGSDVARDEASRDLVIALREMLENRVEGHRVAWANEVASNLDDGHIVRALRLSSHPPDPAARFSAELATRLRDAAGTALASETPPDRWLAILQAVVESPVRRTVKPQGLPHDPSSELLETARQQCGRVPALAPLLGISVPPPPGPARPGLPIKPPPRHTTRSARPARPPARPAGAPARAPRAASPHSAAAVPEAAPAELSVGAPGEVAAEPTADVAAEPAAQAEVSEAEVTAEPAAEAEVSEVEVTEPEVTEPTAEPDVAAEPVAQVEVAEPDVVAEPVAQAEVSEVEVTEVEVTEVEVTEAEVTEPTAEPDVPAEPVAQVEVAEPDVVAEPVAEAEVTEAEVSEVEVTEPEVVENGTADVTEPPIALRALD